MARTPRDGDSKPSHYLRAWRESKNITLERLAELVGMTHQNLGKIERGRVPLGEQHLPALADAFGIEVGDLFRNPARDRGEQMVPVIGYVGANPDGEVLFSTGDQLGELTPIPPGGSDRSVALWVKGHSMRGTADDGSLIYFENQHTPPTPDMLGHVVVVETETGEVLIKRLLKGSNKGVYDLESLAGPRREDVRLRWAAHISAIVPPHMARRIVRRPGEDAVA